ERIRRHSSDKTKDTSDSIKLEHEAHTTRHTDSGSTWKTHSSTDVHVSKSSGSGTRHHSTHRKHIDRHGHETSTHSSHTSHFSPTSSTSSSGSSSHSSHKAPHYKHHVAKDKHKGNIANIHDKVHGNKKVKKGLFDFFFGKKKPKFVEIQQPDA